MENHHELISPNLRTTSRVVAEKFGKMHKNVLRDIEKLAGDVPEEFNRLNFEPVDYLDAKGEARPEYQMTRDGFTLLAMGFTGKAAMEWKVRFIEAFNLMEAELAARMAAATDAPLPVVFGDDLTTREKISTIRETRMAYGIHAARRMWQILKLPDVGGQGSVSGLLADPGEGRACAVYLLGLEVGGRQVSGWLADGQDDVHLNRLGLRVREDGLFVGHASQVFAGSRWSGGRHRLALAALEGVHPNPAPLSLAGASMRGLVLPFATLAGVHHA